MSHLYHAPRQIALLLCLVGWLCVSPTRAVQVCAISSFAPAHNYSVMDNTGETAAGDFNNDGRLDMVVVRRAGGIMVMLNDKTGGFGVPTYYSTDSTASDEIEVGDFNNDSRLDLAVTNYFSNTISLLFGTGMGDFSPAVNFPSGGIRPQYLASGDFNHDGKLDLAVANVPIGTATSIAILQGNGAGGFTQTSTLPGPLRFTRAADFNNDNNLDLLVQTTNLAIYMGNGQGEFSAPTGISVGASTGAFTIGDFNQDGKQDIAVLVFIGGSSLNIRILLGNGNGAFGSPRNIAIAGVNLGGWITTDDFNLDGMADLVVTSGDQPDGHVLVLRGDGTGSFGAPTSYAVNGAFAQYITSADLNGDGRPDMISSNFDSLNIAVFLNTCLNPTRRYDFDGDGKSDISVFRPSSGYWYLLPSSTNSFSFQQWGLSTDRIVAGDYDGDSKTDYAVYRPSSGTWFILRSTNNTFIAQSFGIATDVPVPADYDADGRTDFAVYRSGAWYILRSSDDQFISQSFGTSSDKPMPADYDGDGKADIAVYRPSDGTWYMLQSTNSALRAQPFGTSNDVPLTGDFDGDGKADVAVFRPSTGTWYTLKSLNGSLLAQRWGVDTDVPVAADYDGDGKTDLAVFRPADGTWYISKSTDGAILSQQFGVASDVPVSAGYLSP